MHRRPLNALLAVCFISTVVQAQYAVEPLTEAAPAEVSEAIRAELASAGLRIKNGADTMCEIWFRRDLPAESPRGIGRSYPELPDTTLLGAMRVVGPMTDNRHNSFPRGVYTIRHGLQPQDGNHAGSTEFIDFGLLLNAKTDTTVAGGFKDSMEMIRRSLNDGGTGHPVVFALLPPSAPVFPSIIKNDRDHWVLHAKIGSVPVAIVLVGVYEH